MKHFPNVNIELMHEGIFETKADMHRLEGEFIQTENSVNKKIEGRSDAEYRRDNKDIIKQRLLNHYKKNKDIIDQRAQDYKKIHKDTIKIYMDEYREKHKDRIKERKSAKCMCEICGGSYSHDHRARHFKTKRHLQAVEENAKKRIEPEEEK